MKRCRLPSDETVRRPHTRKELYEMNRWMKDVEMARTLRSARAIDRLRVHAGLGTRELEIAAGFPIRRMYRALKGELGRLTEAEVEAALLVIIKPCCVHWRYGVCLRGKPRRTRRRDGFRGISETAE